MTLFIHLTILTEYLLNIVEHDDFYRCDFSKIRNVYLFIANHHSGKYYDISLVTFFTLPKLSPR